MSQSVYFGENKIQKLKPLLKQYSTRKIFLVTGKNSYHISGAKGILEHLLGNFTVTRFSDFANNPDIQDVKKGISIFKENQYDLVIAVGGGSVMDMAKLINILSHQDGKCENIILKKSEIKKKGKPLICIPTTAGSGSEATHFAVVYMDGKKYSVTNNFLLPSTVFLLPELTLTTSSYLTAVTGLDAFSHAIESWWSINSTKNSINYSKQAVELIWDNLKADVKNNAPSAKAKMMEASHLAGKAINITKTTAPHALSYGFTTYCGLPHGHAVALFLPKFVHFHQSVNEQNCNDNRGVEWVKRIMVDISHWLDIEFEQLASEIVDFINKCGISINFKELNISKKLFEKAIGNFSKERLRNNPVNVDNKFLTNLYNSELNKEKS